MTGRRRPRIPTVILASPLLLAAAFLAAPWGRHRLAENGLLPGDVIEPYATLTVWTAGTLIGDGLVWWLDRASDGHF